MRLSGGSARTAIVHDWLTARGGAENVTLRMVAQRPDADLYASIYEPRLFPELDGREVRTTFLNRIPTARTRWQRLLPLMPLAFERLDLTRYELVISSSHSCAKNVLTPPSTYHLCYSHTPMRYAWEPAALRGERIGPLARLALPALLAHLRRVDLAGAQRVDRFVANSRHVAARIRTYYGREALVVHPPVELRRFLSRPRKPGDFYLVVSRLVPYKRVDLAVEACARLGRPLVVVGDGRERERLEQLAGGGVTFLGHASDARVEELLAECRALLFPGEEDFGIVPVEAQAAGAPVIAYGVGGVLDSVEDGRTGVLFGDRTVASMCDAIERFESLKLDSDEARASAARFDPERFDDGLERAVEMGPESPGTFQLEMNELARG